MMRTPPPIRRLRKDTGGAAAAEMAMVLPLLLVLMFGSFEMGRYFLDEHVVLKAVRDGARYASRQRFTNFTCPAGTVDATVAANTRNVVRYGKPVVNVGDQPRLHYWQATTSGGQPTITVTLTCPTSLDGTEAHSGLYSTSAHVPIVTVHASVAYDSLFGALGLGSGAFNLTAESQSAVMGS